MPDESNKLGRFRGKVSPPRVERDLESQMRGALMDDTDGSKRTVSGRFNSDSVAAKKVVTTGTWTPSLTFDSVTIQAGRLVQLLNPIHEARTQALKKKLIGELSRLSFWASNRNITSITQVESMLDGFPHSVQRAILSLCDTLKNWVQESHSKLDAYPSSWSSSPRSRVENLELIIEAYDLLETLRSVNDGFYALAGTLSNRKIDLEFGADTNAPTLPIDLSIKSKYSTATTSSPYYHELPTDQTHIGSSALKVGKEIVDSAGHEAPEADKFEEDEVTSNSTGSPSGIQIFFLNCKYAMQVVTTQMAVKETPKHICIRLVVWGCGLFSAALNLDHILDNGHLQHSHAAAAFRDHLIGILADIAVILENILRSFSPCTDPDVKRALTRLQACFGKYKEFREAAMEDESSLRGYLDESAVEERPDLPQYVDNGGLEALRESSLEQLDGLVDCLFDILPAIDRLRQTWLLDLERQSHIVAASLAESSATATSPAGETVQRSTQAPGPSTAETFDELDFTGTVPDDILIASRDKSIATPKMSRSTKLEIENPVTQSPEETSGYERFLSPEDKKSLQDLLATDIQLATAARSLLEESRVQAAKEKRNEKSFISQINTLDEEIKRLDGWSAAFHSSLTANPSEAEIKKQWSIFEQLAKIGSTFTTALMRNKKTSKTAKDAKRKIDMVTRTMSKRAGSDLPFEFDMGDGSFDVALDTFNKANGQLYELAAGYPAVKRAASDSVKSQVSVVWDQPPRIASAGTAYTSYTSSTAPSSRLTSDYIPHPSYAPPESPPAWKPSDSKVPRDDESSPSGIQRAN